MRVGVDLVALECGWSSRHDHVEPEIRKMLQRDALIKEMKIV